MSNLYGSHATEKCKWFLQVGNTFRSGHIIKEAKNFLYGRWFCSKWPIEKYFIEWICFFNMLWMQLYSPWKWEKTIYWKCFVTGLVSTWTSLRKITEVLHFGVTAKCCLFFKNWEVVIYCNLLHHAIDKARTISIIEHHPHKLQS